MCCSLLKLDDTYKEIDCTLSVLFLVVVILEFDLRVSCLLLGQECLLGTLPFEPLYQPTTFPLHIFEKSYYLKRTETKYRARNNF
jgi:hypothetical protein